MTRRLLSPDLLWPVSGKEVARALESVSEQVTVSWASWHREGCDQFLEAEWVPVEGGSIGALPGRGALLWIRPVSRPWSADDRVAGLGALDAAAAWLRDAIAAGDPWKASRHRQAWTFPSPGEQGVFRLN